MLRKPLQVHSSLSCPQKSNKQICGEMYFWHQDMRTFLENKKRQKMPRKIITYYMKGFCSSKNIMQWKDSELCLLWVQSPHPRRVRQATNRCSLPCIDVSASTSHEKMSLEGGLKKNRTTAWPSKPTSGYTPEGKEATVSKKHLYVFFAALFARAKVERTPTCVLTDEWVQRIS